MHDLHNANNPSCFLLFFSKQNQRYHGNRNWLMKSTKVAEKIAGHSWTQGAVKWDGLGSWLPTFSYCSINLFLLKDTTFYMSSKIHYPYSIVLNKMKPWHGNYEMDLNGSLFWFTHKYTFFLHLLFCSLVNVMCEYTRLPAMLLGEKGKKS